MMTNHPPMPPARPRLGGGLARALPLLLALLAPAPAWADAFDAGVAAYEKADYAEAREQWETALAAGDWVAARNLGTLYRRGLGVAADPARAREYYRLAADNGVLAASLNLAEMLLAGQGGPADAAEAKRLLTVVAETGFMPARLRLEEIESAERLGEASPPLDWN